MEPKKAPPPDILRRLFGYTDPEPAPSTSAASAAGSSSGRQDAAVPRRRGGAQFAEPVPGDFAYSGEQPRLAGRSTKPPTPRRVKAVSRGGNVREGGGLAANSGQNGGLPAPLPAAKQDEQSLGDNVGGRRRDGTAMESEGSDTGSHLQPSGASVQRGG